MGCRKTDSWLFAGNAAAIQNRTLFTDKRTIGFAESRRLALPDGTWVSEPFQIEGPIPRMCGLTFEEQSIGNWLAVLPYNGHKTPFPFMLDILLQVGFALEGLRRKSGQHEFPA